MIELKRHLEILLLDNDCVVVPDFGGFVAYHVSAHFDETDGVFIPPKRTVGFNPQLKMNDSLLAQSYVEAYDISYPDAVQRIENEVAELRETIAHEGSYTLDGIGTLSCNDDGGYLFTPCESGILTPDLYGLSTFSLAPAAKDAERPALRPVSVHQTEAEPPVDESDSVPAEDKTVPLPHPTLTDVMDEDDEEERAIRIKLSWIRNVSAVAAAVLLFLLMSKPVANSNYSSQAVTALEHHMVYRLAANDQPAKPATATPATKETQVAAPTVAADSIKVQPEKTAKPETTATPTTTQKPSTVQQTDASRPYCLVLASRVKMSNAEEFVKKLKKQGFADAEIYVHNKVVRVVYGHFRTEGEAYGVRNSLQQEADFADAWVYKKQTEV